MPPARDPADALDARADGAFSGAPVNRRNGYGNALAMALRMARKGATLGAGEGALLVEHYEALVAEAFAEGQRSPVGDFAASAVSRDIHGC